MTASGVVKAGSGGAMKVGLWWTCVAVVPAMVVLASGKWCPYWGGGHSANRPPLAGPQLPRQNATLVLGLRCVASHLAERRLTSSESYEAGDALHTLMQIELQALHREEEHVSK